MRRFRLDDRTVDRLVAGTVTSEDAPPGYAGVASLLQAARTEPAAGELAREAATVASMKASILGTPVPLHHTRRNNVLSKALAAKAVGVAAVVLLGAGSAAAATGSLPDQAQSTAQHVLANLNISVPGPNSHSNGPHGKSADHPSNNEQSNGPNSHANFGLCTAEEAHADAGVTPNTNATVWPSSSTCDTVVKPGPANDNGKPASPGSQGTANKPSDTPAGPPSSTPPVSTPDMGAASNGANSTGISAATSGAGNSTDRGRP
jgi:hypothetical protein